MTESIMQDEKACFVTKSTRGLDRHHCFKGSRRKASERYGLWVWLQDHHQQFLLRRQA